METGVFNFSAITEVSKSGAAVERKRRFAVKKKKDEAFNSGGDDTEIGVSKRKGSPLTSVVVG